MPFLVLSERGPFADSERVMSRVLLAADDYFFGRAVKQGVLDFARRFVTTFV